MYTFREVHDLIYCTCTDTERNNIGGGAGEGAISPATHSSCKDRHNVGIENRDSSFSFGLIPTFDLLSTLVYHSCPHHGHDYATLKTVVIIDMLKSQYF